MRSTVAVLVLAIAVAGCGSATPSRSSQVDPKLALDVPTYRGDAARTGQMPGPGPSGHPRVIWQFQATAGIDTSPVVMGGLVVVASTDGVVHAIDLASGTERWSKDLGSEVNGTPVCVAGSVIVGDGAGVLHALDPASGAERWTLPTDGAINGAPAASGSTVVAATEAGTAWGIDATTGHERWHVALPGPVRRSVAIDADLAYVGVTPGQLLALRIGDGSIKWKTSVEDSGDIGTPAVAAGQVIAATGADSQDAAELGVVAVDAGTGATRWRYASPTGAKVYTPAVAGDGAFVIGHDRELVRLGASDGSIVWTTALDAEAEALPAVADGTVYVASNGGHLLAFDVATGHELWRAPITGIPFAPVVTGGYVLVPTSVGVVVAIGDGG